MNISVALFVKVFFYALSNSEFMVLAHNPGIFIFEKEIKEHNVMFFEHKMWLNCL